MPAGSTIEDVISNPEKRDELTAFLQKKSAETFHEWQLEIKRRPSYSPDRPTATEYEKMRDMCHYRALLGNWASKAYPKEKTAKE